MPQPLTHDESEFRPALCFARMDIEKRLGFPAGRFTQPGPLLPLLLAALAAVGFYAALIPIEGTWFWQTFTQRGWVPYATVFFSGWALMILLVKVLKVRLQRRAQRLDIIPDDPSFFLSPATVDRVLDRLHDQVDDPRHFMLANRVQLALSNLRNMGRIGDVDDVLQSQAEADEGMVESSYTVVRGLIWAIPVLGFIGTVLGLTRAIGSFGDVLAESAEAEALRPALQSVTAGLATAFETTLQALVAAVFIHLLLTMVKRSEERMLDDFQDWCQRRVVTRLRLRDAGGPAGANGGDDEPQAT